MALVVALGAVGVIAVVVMALVGILVYNSYANGLVAPDELAINQASYGAKIYDRNGKLLYEYVDDRSGLRRPVALTDISPALIAATVATEDNTFFTNPGINIKGLTRAAWENFSPFGGTPGVLSGPGGSSITQQLVKNVYIPQQERLKKSITRKLKETVYAIELTRRYSKEQILGWYLNQISYGGVYNGVEAASEGYFGKSAKDLTLGEAALLAGLPQSPAAYDPVNHPEAAEKRRQEVLDLIQRQGRIQIGEDKYFTPSADDLAAARSEQIAIAQKRFPIQAPHFVLEYVEPQLRRILGCPATSDEKCDPLYRDGLVVTTTLDIDLQQQANDVLENWISKYEATSNDHNGAVLVLDPKTGEILTMVGSRDYFRDDIQGQNNYTTALRSPGSSFKPFVYLTSFLKLGWGPGTVILDTPVSYKQPDGSYFTPVNPAHNFQGPVTIRNALGNSLNVPAVKTADVTGVGNIVQQARKMGFTTLNGTYGPAIATGGVDLMPLEMAYGYTVFADGGVMIGQQPLVAHRADERKLDPIAILKVTNAKQQVVFDVDSRRGQQRVVDEAYTYLVTNILTDGQAQCLTWGCGGLNIKPYDVAVKTGTSQPFDPNGPNATKIGDTWAFGYTPDVVVAVWSGNASPLQQPIVNIFSTSIAFQVMRDTLLDYYNGRPETAFHRPEGVVQATVCEPSGMKPTPLCGRTTSDLFAANSLPQQDDTWWQNVRIDSRNGLLAAPNTPPQFIQQQVMLVLPPNMLQSDDDKARALDWANTLGLPLAPTEVSNLPPTALGPPGTPGLPATPGQTGTPAPGDAVQITFPVSGAGVSGPVQVKGQVTTAGFQAYRLEYGVGASPTNWIYISQSSVPVANGALGVWDTSSLAPGTYSLRLVVVDRNRGQIMSSITVTVGSP